jgi:hypothetical protein
VGEWDVDQLREDDTTYCGGRKIWLLPRLMYFSGISMSSAWKHNTLDVSKLDRFVHRTLDEGNPKLE